MKKSGSKNMKKKSNDLTFLISVGKILVGDLSTESALKIFLELVCEYTGWHVGHIYYPNYETKKLAGANIWHFNGTQNDPKLIGFFDNQLHVPEKSLSSKVWHSGEFVFLQEVKKDLYLKKALSGKKYDEYSAFSVPVIVGHRACAVAEFFMKTWKFDFPQLEMINVAAQQFGSSLERRSTQLQLAHTEKMASLGEMAGGMAHEINTPLGAITLSASQLKDLIPTNFEHHDVASEIIQDILDSSEKISRIVRGLKNFSRESKAGDDFVFCDLVSVLNESLALCDVLLRNKNIELRVKNCPKSLNVKCNPSQISQVIVNLVSNARDAIEGLKEKWIEISLSEMSENIQLKVTDSGSGIPIEVREKLFHPFFTTKKIGLGTGLGLSIVHGIAKKHNGEIFVNHKCANTCFVFYFPKFLSA